MSYGPLTIFTCFYANRRKPPLIAVSRVLLLWVGSSRSGQRENINLVPILTRVGEPVKTRTTQ